MMKKYQVAGISFLMDARYDPLLTRAQAYEYAGEEKAAFSIAMDDHLFSFYRNMYPEADEALLEYMITGAAFYTELISHKGLMLHASAVVVDGNAYLFSAPSGTGKSTHTALWLKKFGERAYILNDDKPALRLFPDGVYAYGTPWSGKFDLSSNRRIPLRGIAFLERADNNEIAPMPPSRAIAHFLEETVRSKEPEYAANLLDTLSQLLQSVPVWDLKCNMDPQAAEISYEAMEKGLNLCN